MRPIVCMLAAVGLAAAAAQAQLGAPALDQGRTEFRADAASAVEVLRAKTGHLLVKPLVNGHEPGWFIFDTGAGICVVSTPHLDGLGLAEAGSIDALGVGGGKASRLYRATSVSLGPVTLHDHPIMATDLSFLKQHLGEEIAGVIGYGVLSRCVAEIEIGDAERPARLALHDPASYELAGATWQALELEGRVPAVHASFEGHEGLFRIDTGANGFVTFHQPAVEKWKLLEGRDVTDARLGGVGGFVPAKKGVVGWFELGGVRREAVPATFATEAKGTFADASKDGNIGAELLRPFRMVMDYANERAAFVPAAR